MILEKLTRAQFYYRDCEIAFHHKRYFGAGHATNNTVDLVVLVVSSAELVESLEAEHVLVKLKHMPRALWYGTSRNWFFKLHRSFRRERL